MVCLNEDLGTKDHVTKGMKHFNNANSFLIRSRVPLLGVGKLAAPHGNRALVLVDNRP